jgi:hypothetical protein
MTKLSHFFFVLISALLLVALIIVSFYWTCKAVNKFYLSRSATNTSPDETLQPSDNELEMPKEKKRLKSLDIFRGAAVTTGGSSTRHGTGCTSLMSCFPGSSSSWASAFR